MKALFSMIKYIRKNWKLWGGGILFPAFFSMAANIYFANILQDYVAKLTEHQTSLQGISKMLLFSLPVLLLLSNHHCKPHHRYHHVQSPTQAYCNVPR